MHDGMPYGRNQGQGQGHSREVDRQSPTGLIFIIIYYLCQGGYVFAFVGLSVSRITQNIMDKDVFEDWDL